MLVLYPARAHCIGWVTSRTPREFDMHVLGLRRRLGDDASAPRHVVTVRGVGLRFEP